LIENCNHFEVAMPDSLKRSVQTVRGFNRLYTRTLGLLDERHLGSEFGLTEVRVLYELAHSDRPTAAAIARALGLDPGHLSRVLRGFRRGGLIRQKTSTRDRRESELQLTASGRRVFARLDARANAQVASLLEAIPATRRAELVSSLEAAGQVLGADPARRDEVMLRPHRTGDLGWMVERHGALYCQEYGWDERFEAIVAGIVAEFGKGHDPKREACWIAERNGARVGSVMLVRHPEREDTARLRLLLLEPSARGLGIGRSLVETCTRFARAAGYGTILLWTQSVLVAARAIYAHAGYRKISEEPNPAFGRGLVAETWELSL
jgi:DNA-binding MarR family transcriptional regulator/GNAT superfamily N-acetyltransferase